MKERSKNTEGMEERKRGNEGVRESGRSIGQRVNE